jgi:hypothetical protein
MRSSHVVLDQVDIAFDDEHAVASAGLLLPATLAERLGIEQAADQLVDLGGRPGAARPGRKLLTLVHAMIPKPGSSKRLRLGIATVRDRMVQAALKLVLEPIWEADFQPCSYGFRPERRAQDAIAELGVDMAVFPTAAHLVAWAKFAPQATTSAGNAKTAATGKGNPWLAATLGEIAVRPGAPTPSSASATVASPNAAASNAPWSRSATRS